MISALKKSFTQPVNIPWWLTLLFDWKCFLHIRIHLIEIWLYMRIARMKTQHFHNKSEFYFNFFFTFKVNITHEIIEIRRKKNKQKYFKEINFHLKTHWLTCSNGFCVHVTVFKDKYDVEESSLLIPPQYNKRTLASIDF